MRKLQTEVTGYAVLVLMHVICRCADLGFCHGMASSHAMASSHTFLDTVADTINVAVLWYWSARTWLCNLRRIFHALHIPPL